MVLSGSKFTSNIDSITNKGCLSGGSCGGVKKAGLATPGTMFLVPNIGQKYIYRAQQRTPTLNFMLLTSTKNPVQVRRNGYYSPLLG